MILNQVFWLERVRIVVTSTTMTARLGLSDRISQNLISKIFNDIRTTFSLFLSLSQSHTHTHKVCLSFISGNIIMYAHLFETKNWTLKIDFFLQSEHTNRWSRTECLDTGIYFICIFTWIYIYMYIYIHTILFLNDVKIL